MIPSAERDKDMASSSPEGGSMEASIDGVCLQGEAEISHGGTVNDNSTTSSTTTITTTISTYSSGGDPGEEGECSNIVVISMEPKKPPSSTSIESIDENCAEVLQEEAESDHGGMVHDSSTTSSSSSSVGGGGGVGEEEEECSDVLLSMDIGSPKARVQTPLPTSEVAMDSKKKVPAMDKASGADIDMMKERYAKLLLGEDMSGGGKGVSTALAISNAITNLSASVFGELWRLEPLAEERRAMWHREMDCLLAVSDHIVEFVPSHQSSIDGTPVEVMITKPRTDLHMNLPALRKLDTMLLEYLDGFSEVEFWYNTDRGSSATETEETDGGSAVGGEREDEKWWLPTPRVPVDGLPVEARKHLRHVRECIGQILKAALAINRQVLSETEVPAVYWDTLPKNGKSSLGETVYRIITADHFSPESLVSTMDFSSEHNILELVNRLEAAMHIWRRKVQMILNPPHSSSKDGKFISKPSWGVTRNPGTGIEKWELCADRAESLLIMLRHKFPGLPQTILDMSKIQHNKDVGQSILESYSRVLESLAFNIISRIDDVLRMDDLAKGIELSRSFSTTSISSCSSLFVSLPINKANANLVVSNPTQTITRVKSSCMQPGWVSPTNTFSRTGTGTGTSDWSLGKGLDVELRHMLRTASRKQALLTRVNKVWSNMANLNSLHNNLPGRD